MSYSAIENGNEKMQIDAWMQTNCKSYSMKFEEN